MIHNLLLRIITFTYLISSKQHLGVSIPTPAMIAAARSTKRSQQAAQVSGIADQVHPHQGKGHGEG